MAKPRYLVGNRVIWVPDSITIPKEGIKLDPNLSPMDNLWRVVNAQVSIWLCKYKVYTDYEEDMQDLENSFAITIVNELKRRLRLGKYRRDMSLWLNVRSCAWGTCSWLLRRFKKHMNEQKMLIPLSAGADDDDSNLQGIVEMIPSEKIPRLKTKYDDVIRTMERQRKGHKSKPRLCYSKERIPQYMEDDWMDYLESCYECGIEPAMSQDEYLGMQYPEAYKPTPSR